MLLLLPEYQPMILADVLENGTEYKQVVLEAFVMLVTGVSFLLFYATGKIVKAIRDGDCLLRTINRIKTSSIQIRNFALMRSIRHPFLPRHLLARQGHLLFVTIIRTLS